MSEAPANLPDRLWLTAFEVAVFLVIPERRVAARAEREKWRTWQAGGGEQRPRLRYHREDVVRSHGRLFVRRRAAKPPP